MVNADMRTGQRLSDDPAMAMLLAGQPVRAADSAQADRLAAAAQSAATEAALRARMTGQLGPPLLSPPPPVPPPITSAQSAAVGQGAANPAATAYAVVGNISRKMVLEVRQSPGLSGMEVDGKARAVGDAALQVQMQVFDSHERERTIAVVQGAAMEIDAEGGASQVIWNGLLRGTIGNSSGHLTPGKWGRRE